MITDLLYVPILKWRQGERLAVSQLSPHINDLIIPLAEIPPPRYDHVREQATKTLQDHLDPIPEQLKKSRGDLPIFVDFYLIDINRTPTPDIQIFLDKCLQIGVRFIPIIQLNDKLSAFLAQAPQYRPNGICLRITEQDAIDPNLTTNILGILKMKGLSPGDVDLLIDLREVNDEHEQRAKGLAKTALRAVPRLAHWRSLILASGAFPLNLAGLPRGANLIHRTDWAIWQSICSELYDELPQIPTYGDYAIAHPEHTEIDPRTMRMSANIRYTTDNTWLVLKGRSTRDYGFDQFHDLCADLIGRPEYCGPNYSHGDEFIEKCALRKNGPGNATTWRQVGTNHHITFVVGQISNMFSASSSP